MFIAIRTDSIQAELYLLDPDGRVIDKKIWDAARKLARDLLGEVESILDRDFSKLRGIVIFRGPGSFTGLRIGITTMNALAYAQSIPIVGTSGQDWIIDGINRLLKQDDDRIVLPEYGAPANITQPRR